MKMILIENVTGLGKAGEVVNAKTGYARNYLLPNGLAIEATRENLKQWEKEQEEKKQQEAENRKEALDLKEKLEKGGITLKVKTGAGDRLFGSITGIDIANALKSQMDLTIDKKKIELKEPIKALKKTTVNVRVYPEIVAELPVEVIKAE